MKIKEIIEIVEIDNLSCIVESNLSRVHSHLKNGHIAISASRDTYNNRENSQRTSQLKRDVRNLGYGFVVLAGGFKEENEDKTSVDVVEQSLLIPYIKNKGTFEEFIEIFHSLANKFEQDAILVVEPNGKKYYLDKNKNIDVEFANTNFSADDAKYFSALAKGNHRKRKWAFEGIVIPDTTAGKHIAHTKGMIVTN